ncbi:hypothetical protein BU24DRAFT_251300 [Aaosphaeria arxii CBS 175.79]|uniref:Mid2 domain-containing protein n=1 Tax=Aaosphaeria arxii CBS 175.79 TaxID=1450172 RepID=A0A6A5XMD1_9PLEO|nr:uncharacterized protein BU24DRAFT_251300 [Aaosphaeria arxii CBS 175.79]KAF2014029.1 hypothetical protein BU24DRAFT_251300 [Aaosphaeria arxii CBS 175.79]
MAGRIYISLLSALALSQVSNALDAAADAPADPTITARAILPRQNNDRFMGWLEVSGTWFSEQCNEGLTWYQDGKYAQCCPTSLASCYAPTACVSGSLIYPYSDISSTRTIGCGENFGNTAFSICNTAFIFENFGDSNPKTDIVCGVSSVNWSYYRKIPASATEIVSSDAPSSAIPQSSVPNAANPSSASASASSSSSTSVPEKKEESSKAWIAGAVVGPIVGLALIGAGIFFFLRRKKSKKVAAAGGPGGLGGAPAGVAVGGQQPYTDAKPQMAASPQPGYTQPMGSPGYGNNQEQYNQYGAQQAPLSPAPQYSAPYNQPGSPPPQGHFAPNDQKQTFAHSTDPAQPQAAELGGSGPVAGSHTAELSGEPTQR